MTETKDRISNRSKRPKHRITHFNFVMLIWIILLSLRIESVSTLTRGDDILLFARKNTLYWIDLSRDQDSGTLIPVYGVQNAVAIDYDPVEQLVYWTDVKTNTINRAKLDGSGQDVVFSDNIETPDGMNVDWENRVIYWTDAGEHVLEAAYLNGTGRHTILSDLEQPRAIVLDKQDSMIYWTDWGSNPMIERMKTDGSVRETLINTSLFRPNGLVLDTINELMYWADAHENVIERAGLDGSGRHQIASGVSHAYGLAIHGDYLYWSDWNEGNIQRANMRTLSDHRVVTSYMTSFMGLKAVQISTGNNMLYVAGRTEIRGIPLDEQGSLGDVIPLSDVTNAVVVDYNPRDDRVYWTDVSNRQINTAFRNGTGQMTLVDRDITTPDGMAVSVQTQTIFWSDTGTDKIERCNMDGSDRQVVLHLGLDEPRAIALDDSDRLLYWTDWGEQAAIERATYDGQSREVIVNSSLVWPNGLALDTDARIMYFADGMLNKIEQANFDGTDRQLIVSNVDVTQQVFGLAFFGDYLYWTDWILRSVTQMDTNDRSDVRVIMDGKSHFMGLHVSPRAVYRPPEVSAVYPLYGPIAGGTVITVTGAYLPQGARLKFGEDMSLAILESSPSRYLARTPSVNNTYTRHRVQLYFELQEGVPLDTGFRFEYKANPRVNSLHPLRTIVSGGITITVIGSSFDSVANPQMSMTFAGNSQRNHQETREHVPCQMKDSTVMHCVTPAVGANGTVTCGAGMVTGGCARAYIGFLLDGATENSRLHNYSLLDVLPDPTYQPDQRFVYTDRDIYILGTNYYLTSNEVETEYAVLIGSEPCTALQVRPNTVRCRPPAPDQENYGRTHPIKVQVGLNLIKEVGLLTYPMTTTPDATTTSLNWAPDYVYTTSTDPIASEQFTTETTVMGLTDKRHTIQPSSHSQDTTRYQDTTAIHSTASDVPTIEDITYSTQANTDPSTKAIYTTPWFIAVVVLVSAALLAIITVPIAVKRGHSVPDERLLTRNSSARISDIMCDPRGDGDGLDHIYSVVDENLTVGSFTGFEATGFQETAFHFQEDTMAEPAQNRDCGTDGYCVPQECTGTTFLQPISNVYALPTHTANEAEVLRREEMEYCKLDNDASVAAAVNEYSTLEEVTDPVTIAEVDEQRPVYENLPTK